MTGGSVGGDLLAPEDVVSLLLDDVQLQQKFKDIAQVGYEIWSLEFIILQYVVEHPSHQQNKQGLK